jgi:hypothetical protein
MRIKKPSRMVARQDHEQPFVHYYDMHPTGGDDDVSCQCEPVRRPCIVVARRADIAVFKGISIPNRHHGVSSWRLYERIVPRLSRF